MRAERALLRVGEYLVRGACRRLPREVRDDRRREWTAELPAILHDPEVRLAPVRAIRMLGYAADTVRGTLLSPGRTERRPAARSSILLGLVFTASLANAAWGIWSAVRAPGHWVTYVQLAWALLLVAWPVGQYAWSAARVTGLIPVGGCLAGLAVYSWNAARAPADWVNYFAAALLFFLLLTWWLIRRGPASAIARAVASKIRR
jgi:hypothetical protein